MTCLTDVRHIKAIVDVQSIPSSISNLWNLQSLVLRRTFNGTINLPETAESLWRMKSLRHIKILDCKFEVSSDGYELNAYPQLDKLVSFSRPVLSTGKDMEWLLQRLPVVRELSCILDIESLDSVEERVETFDIYRKLESLKLCWRNKNHPYSINFPSTLIKLTLEKCKLTSIAISTIVELQCLRVLKLRSVKFPGPTWEIEDVTFLNLKYFELRRSNLKLWNASTDSFPCLEHLFFDETKLEELPPCLGEISSLKKIIVDHSPKLESSALRVQEEHMDLGTTLSLLYLSMTSTILKRSTWPSKLVLRPMTCRTS